MVITVSQSSEKKGRYLYMDMLRILACLCVVMSHAAAAFWYTDIGEPSWIVANIYDCFSRYGVPIFVMISGALFLTDKRPMDIHRLYTHNIFRLFFLYAVWSAFYGMKACIDGGGIKVYGVKKTTLAIVTGEYHLWYLPMLIGIYMLLPILRTWIDHAERKNVEYFLSLFLIVEVARKTALFFLEGHTTWIKMLEIPHVEMACSYIGYFILGYYLMTWEPAKMQRRAIYAAGIAGLLLSIAISTYTSIRAGRPRGEIFDSFSIFTVAQAAALFVLFRYGFGQKEYSEKITRVIRNLSASTLGIYLMHVFFMGLFTNYALSYKAWDIVVIPLWGVGTYIICNIVTAILRRIPFVRRLVS